MTLVLYKRWTLRDGATVDQVRRFVEEQIIPAYRDLSSEVALDLEVDGDGASILAIQRWSTPAAHHAATAGTAYKQWWSGYEPTLVGWNRLVSFAEEWSTQRVDLDRHL